MPVFSPPFSAAARAVSFHDGAVDQIQTVARFGCQRIEGPLPDAASRPAIEAIVDGRVGTILGRAIAPARAALEHMNDAADDPTIILPARS